MREALHMGLELQKQENESTIYAVDALVYILKSSRTGTTFLQAELMVTYKKVIKNVNDYYSRYNLPT